MDSVARLGTGSKFCQQRIVILSHIRGMAYGKMTTPGLAAQVLAQKNADASSDTAYCKYDSQKLQTFTSVLFLAGAQAPTPPTPTAHVRARARACLLWRKYRVERQNRMEFSS